MGRSKLGTKQMSYPDSDTDYRRTSWSSLTSLLLGRAGASLLIASDHAQ